MTVPVPSASPPGGPAHRALRGASNLAALFGVQIANAALPLLAFPHLLNVAGHARYAEVVLAEALALAVLTLALYSFDINAVSRVVGLQERDDSAAISKAYSDVLWARMAIFLPAAALALLGCLAFAPALLHALAWWLLLPLSHIVQSAWMFQGLERNLPIAVATLLSRIGSIALILTLVDGSDAYLLVPAFIGSTALVGAFGLAAYVRWSLGIRLHRVSANALRSLFVDGGSIFFGNCSVFMYRDMNVVLLGASGAGATAVAAYSMAEKLVKGIQAMARPLNQFFFPKAVRAIRHMTCADRRALRTLAGLTWPQMAAVAALVLGLCIGWLLGADRLPMLRDLPERDHIGMLVLAMTPAIFVGISNFTLGSVGLNHLGNRRFLFLALLTVGLLNLAVCSLLAFKWGSGGAASAFVFSELLLAFLVVGRYLVRGKSGTPGAPGNRVADSD